MANTFPKPTPADGNGRLGGRLPERREGRRSGSMLRTDRICVGLAAALLLVGTDCVFGQIQLDAGPQFAKIHVHAVDLLGHQIRHANFGLVPTGGEGKLPIESSSGDFSHIPYGKYVLRAMAAGFNIAQREIKVDRREVWVTVALLVWEAHAIRPEPTLAGEVIPPISTKTAWAKLVGVYNDVTMEAAITEGRFFHFEPEAPGIYVVMIIDDGRILDLTQVEVQGYKRLQLQLPK